MSLISETTLRLFSTHWYLTLVISSFYCPSVCLVSGFIDFIVEPTFSVLIDTTEKVIGPLIDEDRKARESGNRKSRYCHYCQVRY